MKEKSIMLVEDNNHDEQLTLRELRKNNIANEIVIARDGEEALDLLFRGVELAGTQGNGLPEALLLDLNLPKVDGLEVLRRIRNDSRTKTLPVVVLTASDEDRDRIKAYSLGINGYVRKPVRFGELGNAARDLGLFWLLMKHMPFRGTRWQPVIGQ
jgi:two-component system response regulator